MLRKGQNLHIQNKKNKNSTDLISEITRLSIFLEQTMSDHSQDNQNQANTNTISQQEYSFRNILWQQNNESHKSRNLGTSGK